MKSADIKYDSELHKQIIAAVSSRKKYSERKMNDFKGQWDAADDSLRAYIPEKEADKIRKNKKTFEGKIDYVTLEVPYIYGQVMTAHTYWSTIFLSRSPVWQFMGRHGETQDSVDAVEAIHDYQLKAGLQLPVMFNWIYDWARYNLGIIGIYWEKCEKVVSSYVEEPMTVLGIPIPGKMKTTRKEEIVPGFVGNRLYNVRPQDFFPDPRVPIWRFQDGEFVIRETSEGWSDIKSYDSANPGYYINLKELKDKVLKNKSNAPFINDGNPRTSMPLSGESGALDIPDAGFIKITEAYIKIVPKDWGLGDSLRVEKWCFTVGENEVVIGAKPLGCYHDMFPFGILEGNFGCDSFAKQGLIEIIRPMTDVITWLVNSHFYNVRKTLNDTDLIDPTAVVVKDVERAKKGAGGIIRLKPAAYGRDVRAYYHQLQNSDATANHLGDIQVIMQMIQVCGGVVENIMGMQSSSSRKSATEARISSNWAMNRLKTPAEYNSSLGFDTCAQIMVSNTQQFLDIERKYAIAGNTLSNAQRFMQVNPQMIAGNFDYVTVDGTLPIDPTARATFWKELLMQMARVPQFAFEWDLGGMVAHMMKLQGERNIDRFRVRVLPPGTEPGPNGIPIPMGSGGAGGKKGGPGGKGPTGTSGGAI